VPGSSWRERVDAFQQRHVTLAFPFTVNKRFSEDRGRHYAALMLYAAEINVIHARHLWPRTMQKDDPLAKPI